MALTSTKMAPVCSTQLVRKQRCFMFLTVFRHQAAHVGCCLILWPKSGLQKRQYGQSSKMASRRHSRTQTRTQDDIQESQDGSKHGIGTNTPCHGPGGIREALTNTLQYSTLNYIITLRYNTLNYMTLHDMT